MNPKRSRQQVQGNIGAVSFELFVTRDLGWIYRPVHQESDVGIDGYIDIVDNGKVTGASLAVQIKCGSSYTAKKTIGGLRYNGSTKHLNFYSNLRSPVLLIVLNEKGENGRWTMFRLDQTMPAKSEAEWWIEIPESNVLSPAVKQEWRTIAGPTTNYELYFKQEWMTHEMNSVATNLIVGIEKEYVLKCDPTSLLMWQQQLTKSREMMLSKRGKVEFWFRDWEADPRELWEIPEIVAYFKSTVSSGFPWIYWLQPDGLWIGYRLLYGCTGACTIVKLSKGQRLEMSTDAMKEWLESNFHTLNRFTESNSIAIEVNKEVSNNLFRFMDSTLFEKVKAKTTNT